MIKTAIAVLLCSLLGASAALAQDHGVRPTNGFVRDERTAIAIAVAVWTPIYGAERISRQRPHKARLAGGRWTVEGSLPAGRLGGVALAVIARDDGRVLRVSHGR